jgi:hypothetical protein
MFIYSRKEFLSPDMAPTTMHVRCLISRAARKEPASMAVSPAIPPGIRGLVAPVVMREIAANRLMTMIVNRFLKRGGQEKTSDVPGRVVSPGFLKLSEEKLFVKLLRPKTARKVKISSDKDSRMKLMSVLIICGGLGWPSMRLITER